MDSIIVPFVATCALLITAVTFIRLVSRNDVYIKKIEKNEKTISELLLRFKNMSEVHTIYMETQKCLIYKIETYGLALEELYDDAGDFSFYENEISDVSYRLEKLNHELMLFSANVDDRLSALRALANYSGDSFSLKLLTLIKDNALGSSIPDINTYHNLLMKRLNLHTHNAGRWTGR